ncbi:DUF3857 domain-containing protein [Poritiphilus flavus]|uniref:DUF3857 domain-containing protein n=1 Tax=Poritiphilus flavus TaxID=2697053 RepID=A0A6L9EB78_9FLAO|nr:DUF3857 domain-containing protein [Poritiphilus flavus]NAS11960.1 DUF3857 domain-containing protein [Poritiphilus flavus]
MLYKSPLLIVFVLIHCVIQAQGIEKFGTLTENDKSFEVFEEDPDSPAVVLYERGEFFFITKDNRQFLVKEYHTKIKILKENGFPYGNISIPLLGTQDIHEDIIELKATTHNNGLKTELKEDKIYPSNSQAGVVEIKFTFPNIQVGSILEYKYVLISPFFSNLEGWLFQSTIPKLYSEFNASIPYNFDYNRTLIGDLELCSNEIKMEECFHAMGNTYIFLCENLQYAMENIPAFDTSNEYMLGAANYISRLEFELSRVKGKSKKYKYSTSWEDVDYQFKTDKSLGKQLRYKGFFGRKIPNHLLKEKNQLIKAKNIYNFVRDHYTWNGGYGIYGQSKLKEAFDDQKGNVAEINMSLINLLNAADIKVNLMLTSTRNMGLPKKTYPTMSDFNYVLAKVEIDGQEYLLDATNKHHPFGILPFRALNHYGRVMDFKKGSYWQEIVPHSENKYHVRGLLEIDLETASSNCLMEITKSGHHAVDHFELKEKIEDEEYLNYLSQTMLQGVEVLSYTEQEKKTTEKSVTERINVQRDIQSTRDLIYLNPFAFQFFKGNPFLEENREYPIDFGYPQNFKYQINIKIPDGFKVLELPQKNFIKLGEDLANLRFYTADDNKQITLNFELSFAKSYFEKEDYGVLRELFKKAVEAQNNSLIVLKKA